MSEKKCKNLVNNLVKKLYNKCGNSKEVSMTKKDLALINYTKKVNKRIPRNGDKIMDERAFTKFAKRLSKENKAVLERLADS